MGINYFIYNGRSSLDFGVYVGGQATFNAPQRDVSKVSIPGRNGDLIRDNGRFLNIQVTYNIVVMKEFRDKTAAIREWLKSATSYSRLEDTYNPDYYRMGICTGAIEFETSTFNATGKAQVTFDCKPQRFLKDGEAEFEFNNLPSVALTAIPTIYNPTSFASSPLIRVLGSGTLIVVIVGRNASNNPVIYRMTFTDVSDYIDVDCDTMDCYKGASNLNGKATFSNGFPKLLPGVSEIRSDEGSGSVSVKIVPRWWTV